MSDKQKLQEISVHFNQCWEPSTSWVCEVKRNKPYINWGEDNMAPDYFQSLLRKSHKFNSVMNGIIKLVIGKGFIVPTDKDALRMYNNIGDPRDPETKSRLYNNNMDAILSKIAVDLCLTGGFLINTRWGTGRQNIADMHHVAVKKMRLDADENGFWLSDDWKQERKEKYAPKHWEELSDKKGAAASQLMYVKAPSALDSPYAVPFYYPVTPYIEMANELAEWQINRLKNNFAASTIINYPIQPEVEELAEEQRRIKKTLSGGAKAGFTLLTFGDTKVQPFESPRFPEDITQIEKAVNSAMRSTFQITGDLFGMGNNEGGGITFGKDILVQEYEAYDASMIAPFRKTICEAMNLIAKVNGIDWTFEIEPYELFELKPQSTAANDAAETMDPALTQNPTIDEQQG